MENEQIIIELLNRLIVGVDSLKTVTDYKINCVEKEVGELNRRINKSMTWVDCHTFNIVHISKCIIGGVQMKIKYGEILYGMSDKLPYNGVIIEYIQETDKHSMTDKKLMQLLKNHVDTKCIAFKGDWDKQPLQFLRMVELNKAKPIPLMVITENSFDGFMQNLGIAMWEKVNKMKLDETNDSMLAFMANTLLNYYLDGTEMFFQTIDDGEPKVHRLNPKESVDNLL